MKIQQIFKVVLAGALAVVGMSSCTQMPGWLGRNHTEVDLGGALANVGQKRAQFPTTGYAGISLWEKGGKYYAMLQMVYAPVNYAVLTHRSDRGASRYPHALTAEKLATYQRHTCFAVLDAAQYGELLRLAATPQGGSIVELRRPFAVVPESEVELSGARCTGTLYAGNADPSGVVGLLTSRIPARRTWYNRTLMPLSWAAEVIDIPLSAIATPFGWAKRNAK